MKELTERQQEILVYAYDFYLCNDQIPPMRATARHFRFKSVNAVKDHFALLLNKGYLTRNEVGKYKFTEKTRFAMATVWL